MSGETRREKESFWRSELTLLEKYSGSSSEFCRERGLSLYRLKYWQRRLGESESGKAVAVSPFIAVAVGTVAAPSLPDARWVARIVLHLHRVRHHFAQNCANLRKVMPYLCVSLGW